MQDCLPRAEMLKEKILGACKTTNHTKKKKIGTRTSKGIIGSRPFLTNIPNRELLLESLP